MKYRPLGRTGITTSEIGVGTWQLAGPLTLDGRAAGHPDLGADYVTNLIRKVGDFGVNFIDAAEQYGDGEAERRVAQAIAGRREHWIVCTKFGTFRGSNGECVEDGSEARLAISLEGSLRRLNTDFIDVYLYHVAPDRSTMDAAAEFLLAAKRKGQVRAVGISTNDLSSIQTLHRYGLCDVVQFAQNMIEPAADIEAFLGEHQIGGIVRGALAAGRLSGRYFRSAPDFRSDDVRSVWFTPDNAAKIFARFRAFEALAGTDGSMPQLAVRYLLDRPTTSSVVLGAKRVEDYEDVSRAVERSPLSPDQLKVISTLRKQVTHRRLDFLRRLLGR